MKVTHVDFDDDENPRQFGMVLSLDELALLYRLTGHVAPKTITEAFGNIRWGEALDDLATGAAGVLNTYFEDGANDVIPRGSLVVGGSEYTKGEKPEAQ